MKNLALIVRTLAAWLITLLVVFPLIWLVLTAFKTEQQAIAIPPQLFFTPTLESFAEVNLRSDYLLVLTHGQDREERVASPMALRLMFRFWPGTVVLAARLSSVMPLY